MSGESGDWGKWGLGEVVTGESGDWGKWGLGEVVTGGGGDWGKWGLGEVVTGEVGTVISCKKGCQMSALIHACHIHLFSVFLLSQVTVARAHENGWLE